MTQTSLAPISFHLLEDISFQSSSCPDLALALFQNTSISTIVEKIQECCPSSFLSRISSFCSMSSSGECPKLNEKMTHYEIAPIHLAAMQRNLGAISELASLGADLDARDALGFTPYLHMAMQGNIAGLKLLESLGANTKLSTYDGGTAETFLKYTAPFRDPAEWTLQEKTIKEHHDIDPLCQNPDLAIVDDIVAKPQVLTDFAWNFRDFIPETKMPSKLLQHVKESQEAFSNNPPQLTIRPSPLLTSNACGLFASSPIKKGDIIGYYGGEIHMILNGNPLYGNGPIDPEYLFSGNMPIDAKHFRSPAAMANDGFPNACVLELSNKPQGLNGLPYKMALIACESIQPGEEIVINYGPDHEIKSGGHFELRKDAMLRYFSKSSLDRLMKSIRSSLRMDTLEKAMTTLGFIEKMNYLSTTPGSLEILKTEARLSDQDFNSLNRLFELAVQHLAKM